MFIEDGGGEMFYTLPTSAAASFFRSCQRVRKEKCVVGTESFIEL